MSNFISDPKKPPEGEKVSTDKTSSKLHTDLKGADTGKNNFNLYFLSYKHYDIALHLMVGFK